CGVYSALVQCFVAASGVKGPDADDCRQEAWVRILDRLPEFISDGTQAGLCSWIHAIVRSILAYYDYPISTGPLEGTNNKIKTMQRQAYGFRDREFFKLKIYALHR